MQRPGYIDLLGALRETLLATDAAVGLRQSGDAVESVQKTLTITPIVLGVAFARVGKSALGGQFVIQREVLGNIDAVGATTLAAVGTAVA